MPVLHRWLACSYTIQESVLHVLQRIHTAIHFPSSTLTLRLLRRSLLVAPEGPCGIPLPEIRAHLYANIVLWISLPHLHLRYAIPSAILLVVTHDDMNHDAQQGSSMPVKIQMPSFEIGN